MTAAVGGIASTLQPDEGRAEGGIKADSSKTPPPPPTHLQAASEPGTSSSERGGGGGVGADATKISLGETQDGME